MPPNPSKIWRKKLDILIKKGFELLVGYYSYSKKKNPMEMQNYGISLALTVQKMAQAQKFVHFAPKEFLNHVGT